MSFALKILTPDGSVFDGPADSLTAPGLSGYFGVLPQHTPLVSALGAGLVEVRHEEARNLYVIYGGIAQVRNGTVRILTDRLIPVNDPADAELKIGELTLQCGPLTN